MIISHSKQVCFWKIPRTGSTTIELLLRLLAGIDYAQDVVASGHFFPDKHHNMDGVPKPLNGILEGYTRTHLTPTEAIGFGLLTQAQYDSYENYCMVRDPMEKFISAHSLGFARETFNVPDLIESHVRGNTHWAIHKPQVEWLTEGNMNAMPFSDYENSLTTILTAFGSPIPVDIPSITRRRPRNEEFTRSVALQRDRDAIEAFYAADAALST